MLIECKGIRTEDYYIPPFTLKKGEMLVLNLQNGMHFYNLSMQLKDIFSGKVKHERVAINSALSFVDYFKEPAWRRALYPVTVKEFLKKNSNTKNRSADKIYDIKWITGATKVNTLAGSPRKLLTLYATLSKTKHIVFDLSGIDPRGTEEIFNIVKEEIKNDGAAILLDHCANMKQNCSKYLEAEIFNIKKSEITEFVFKK